MLRKMEEAIIESLTILIDSRDQITGLHVRNTGKYVKILSKELQNRGVVDSEFCEVVSCAAPLHDIGKIAIPDSVLKKEGKYTEDEFRCMQKHTILGSEILEREIALFPESVVLKEAKILAEFHHEKWDGSGYPHGINGEKIPLSARIMAVADVFDALTAKRQYKEAFDFDRSVQIIINGSGTHFDPEIVQTFLNAKERVFQELKKK